MSDYSARPLDTFDVTTMTINPAVIDPAVIDPVLFTPQDSNMLTEAQRDAELKRQARFLKDQPMQDVIKAEEYCKRRAEYLEGLTIQKIALKEKIARPPGDTIASPSPDSAIWDIGVSLWQPTEPIVTPTADTRKCQPSY